MKNFRIRNLLFVIFCSALICYFAYHIISGERGIIAFFRLNNEIKSLNTELESVRAERINLEHKSNLLRPKSLDLDLLEERAKEVLGHAKKNETLFISSEEKE